MGSFNVACSVSNISLSPGDDIVFIPLVKKHFKLGKEYSNWVMPSQFIVYPEDFFSPICLPIRCKYDDYGGIGRVVRDDNVICMEKFLGFPIEEITEHIARRGVYDYFSATAKRYLSEKKLSELSNYDSGLDEKFLELFGFKHIGTFPVPKVFKEEEKVYEYSERILSYFVSIIGKSYTITDSKGVTLATFDASDKGISCQLKDDFLRAFSFHSNYYIGVEKEYQDIVKLLYSMSGMFVRAEIYDTLTEKPYANLYGRKPYAEYLDEYVKVLQELNNMENPTDEKSIHFRWRKIDNNSFVWDFHKGWYNFMNIYENALSEGKLREDFIKHNIFDSNMYSMNRFYFPAMNGEQCGDDEASLALAEKTVEILKNNIKKREDSEWSDLEEDDDEDTV